MDRNSFIGFILIAVVMIVWFQMMTSSEKPLQTPEEQRLETMADALVQDTSLQNDSLAQVYKSSKLGELSEFSEGEEKNITIETDLYKVVLSNKGATIKSFVQKEYFDHTIEPFDLITNEKGALSLLFATRDGKVINTLDVFFSAKVQESAYKITGEQKLKIPFKLIKEDGKRIEVIYTFSGNSYEFGYETNLSGFGEYVSGNEYQVVWTGGLANAEKNIEDEAQSSSADVYLGGSMLKVDASSTDELFKEQPSGDARWIAVRNKYFVASIIAKDETEGAYIEGRRNSDEPTEVFEDYTAALKLKMPFNQFTVNNRFSLYIGPLKYNTLKATNSDLEKVIDFGWEWLTRPFAEYLILPIFNVMDNHIANYGLIIILFALIIKIITYPLTMASTKSMKHMAELQPQLKAIQEKYKDNPQKLQAEIGNIYKEAGVNPLSGCLPTLIQMPLLFAMFYVFRSSIELRQHGFLWINDLSVPDSILDLPFNIPLYGDHISIIPILMAVAVYGQQKLTPTTQSNEQMKFLLYLFPAMMLLFFNNLPSGLGLYYLFFNIFSIAQQFYINQTTEKKPVVMKQTQKPKSKPKAKKRK
jgi:YidC/Oxa1 family membrane protein insertase